jgi:hypothetical protein
METDSGLDLTPCGTPEGTWDPTPLCTQGEDAELACGERPKPSLAETCGAPFDTTQLDRDPPELNFVDIEATVVPREPSEPVAIEVEVSDAGWGIESVELTWSGPGENTWSGVRSIPPFRFQVPAFGVGHHSFYVLARDHAGNRQTEERVTRVEGDAASSSGGCSFGAKRSETWLPVLCLALAAMAARRVRRAATRVSPKPYLH